MSEKQFAILLICGEILFALIVCGIIFFVFRKLKHTKILKHGNDSFITPFGLFGKAFKTYLLLGAKSSNFYYRRVHYHNISELEMMNYINHFIKNGFEEVPNCQTNYLISPKELENLDRICVLATTHSFQNTTTTRLVKESADGESFLAIDYGFKNSTLYVVYRKFLKF
jgi:hypothetical protein